MNIGTTYYFPNLSLIQEPDQNRNDQPAAVTKMAMSYKTHYSILSVMLSGTDLTIISQKKQLIQISEKSLNE